ncbi:MAG: hypothetical protein ACKV2Q_30510 [Planctomycetaceae bacterium]
MDRVFEGHGIRFEYPDDWILHEQSTVEEITLTVHSPDTSFWSLTLIMDRPDPQRVIDSALEAFREEYSEIDVYPSTARLGDQPTESCELDFVCHELIGSAFLRATVAPEFTLLVLYQGADLELDDTQKILEKVSRSLSWDSDDLPDIFNPEVGDD